MAKRKWSELPGWVKAKIIRSRDAALNAALDAAGVSYGDKVSRADKRFMLKLAGGRVPRIKV